ncbi:MAG TPA: pseudouridine synthase [Thermoanaerobaculia bacterium]|nr:pseudouridine synthase [Thermoanaerobaculia bacterium]
MSEDRLQKILARAGFGSRRHVEEMIEEGRVTVNGRVVTVGDKADLEHDAVKVDGKRVHPRSGGHRYLLLNKPRAVMSTVADPEGRPTVLDLVPLGLRRALVPVGRLDFLTEGLILLTDDGDLAQRVAHPRYGCTKTYEVKVRGLPDERSLEKLRRGIVLEGQRTRPASIDPRPSRADSDNTWWTVELGQGRTRQIREMFQRIGHPVMKLRRIAIGPVRDPDLPLGELRELSEREVEMLRRAGKHRARAEAAKAKAAREGAGKGRAKPRKAGKRAKGGKPGKVGKAAAKAAGKAGRVGEPGQGKKGGKAGGTKRAPTGGRTSGGGSARSRPGAQPGAESEPTAGGNRRRPGAVRRGAGDEGASAGAPTGGDRRSNRSPEGAHGRRGPGPAGGRSTAGRGRARPGRGADVGEGDGRGGGRASAGGSGRSGRGGGGAGGGAAGGAPSWFFGVAKPGKGSRTAARGRSAPRDEAESARRPSAGPRSAAGEEPPRRRPPGKPRAARPGAGKPGGGKRSGKPGSGKPQGGERRSGKPGGGKPAGSGRSGPPKSGSGGRGGGRR